jgi:hypothetical protein
VKRPILDKFYPVRIDAESSNFRNLEKGLMRQVIESKLLSFCTHIETKNRSGPFCRFLYPLRRLENEAVLSSAVGYAYRL